MSALKGKCEKCGGTMFFPGPPLCQTCRGFPPVTEEENAEARKGIFERALSMEVGAVCFCTKAVGIFMFGAHVKGPLCP